MNVDCFLSIKNQVSSITPYLPLNASAALPIMYTTVVCRPHKNLALQVYFVIITAVMVLQLTNNQ